VAQHRALWRPERAVLVLAGDCSHAAGMAAAERGFGAWAAAGAPPAVQPLPAVPEGSTGDPSVRTSLIDAGDTGQAAVAVAVRLPRPESVAAFAVADVADAVLGGGYSARLNQEVRIRRGLSYNASTRLALRGGDALLLAVSQTRDASALEVASIVHAILDGLSAEAPGAAELAARRATLIGGFGRSVETTAGLAARVRDCIVEGRPVASLATHVEALLAVTPEAVRAFAAVQLARTARQVGIAGSLDRIRSLAAAEPTRLVTKAELGLDPRR
jgi:zinc protease